MLQCLKESFIKAEGTGLSFGLQNLEFIVTPDQEWPPLLGVCSSEYIYQCSCVESNKMLFYIGVLYRYKALCQRPASIRYMDISRKSAKPTS